MPSIIQIDGHFFQNVKVVSLQRNGTLTEGQNGGASLSGKVIRDVIGTKYDYTLTLSTKDMKPADYDSLYELITAPQESHQVRLPYGQGYLSYEAYITDVSDQLKSSQKNGLNLWGDLSVQFTAIEPQRRPS